MFFCLFTLHIFVLFVSIQFDLLFVMFSLNSVIFFLFCKINIYSFARIACLVWFSSSHNYHIS